MNEEATSQDLYNGGMETTMPPPAQSTELIPVDKNYASILMFGRHVVARVDALMLPAVERGVIFVDPKDMTPYGEPGEGGLQAQMTATLWVVMKEYPKDPVELLAAWLSLDLPGKIVQIRVMDEGVLCMQLEA